MSDAPNVSVTAVSFARSTFSNQERVAVTAVVVNRSMRSLTGGQLALEIGGRPVQTQPLDVEAYGSASVTFDPVTVGAAQHARHGACRDRRARGRQRVQLRRLTGAAGARDRRRSRRHRQRGAVPDARAGDWRRAALRDDREAAGRRVRRRPAPRVDGRAQRRRGARRARPPAGAVRRDAAAACSSRSGRARSWPQEVDILPAALQAPVDRTRGDAARIGALEYGHPVFEPFRAPRSGDFAAARIYGYRARGTVADGAQVLARFDAGAPALLERRTGTGRVLLWTSTLDLAWSDFPLKPVFLPFVHRAVRHLSAYAEPAPWSTVGQVLDAVVRRVRRAAAERRRDHAVRPPGAGGRRGRGSAGADRAGLLRAAARGPAKAWPRWWPATWIPAESDLTRWIPRKSSPPPWAPTDGGPGTAAGVPLPPEAQERSQRLWWYLLCSGSWSLARIR